MAAATIHQLEADGAGFAPDGTLTRGPGRGGAGFARCLCGDVSPESLPSMTARKAWHRDHKRAMVEQAAQVAAAEGTP